MSRRRRSLLAEPPPDSPEPAEGDEGTSRVRKLLGRRSRPSALVVEVGAVAGAILSIVALVQLVTPGGDDDGATTSAERPTPKVTLALSPRVGNVSPAPQIPQILWNAEALRMERTR